MMGEMIFTSHLVQFVMKEQKERPSLGLERWVVKHYNLPIIISDDKIQICNTKSRKNSYLQLHDFFYINELEFAFIYVAPPIATWEMIYRHNKCHSGIVKWMKSPHKDYIHDPMFWYTVLVSSSGDIWCRYSWTYILSRCRHLPTRCKYSCGK